MSGVFFVRVAGVPGPQGSKSYKGMVKSKKTGRMVPRLLESSAKVAPWREAVKYAAIAAKGDLHFDCAVRVTMEFVMPRTAGMDKPRRTPMPTPHHCTTPDLSKLARSTEDSLTDAGVLRNDSRITEYGFLGKRYAEPGEPTGCLIIIERMPEKEKPVVEKKAKPERKPRGNAGRARPRPAGGNHPGLAL